MSVFVKWAQTERTSATRAVALGLAGSVFVGLLPYAIVVLGPRLDHSLKLDFVAPGSASLLIGAFLFVPGALFGFSAVLLQLGKGRGTPLPMIPTHELLTTGPYRYCRNPMTLGTLLMYLGLSVAVGTVSGAVLVLSFGTSLVVYLKYTEEGELTERFGEEYVKYRRDVPFIVPRIPRTL